MSDKYPGGFVTANAPAGFSVAFDGTGDYLNWTGSTVGTAAYTFECWFYTGSFAASQTLIGPNSTTNSGYGFNVASSTALSIDNYGVSASNFTVPAMSTNTWYHVAVVRNGSGVTTVFLNGARSSTGTITDTTNYGNVKSIGYTSSAVNRYFSGYISNARYVTAAVYDPTATTITVPTQMFPTTNTSLLTCQSPTLVDNSTNNFTITASGNAAVSNFTPFAAYQGFNPALGAAAGGVWTIDEAAYYQQNRIWPIYDPYFNQTTLMLHGNGTNAAQNNTFLDSSTNNFTITRNGNTTQGSFSPFSQTGWSTFFASASSQSLTAPNNNAFKFAGQFTIELWVNPIAVSTRIDMVCTPTSASSSTGVYFYIASGKPTFDQGGGNIVTSTADVAANTWTHIALTRNASNLCTIWVNGVASGTATSAINFSDGNLYIGTENAATSYFNGYMSNVRILNGSALYTSNFTPSTQPLTAIPYTVLLTCQNNRFVDNSANNFTITSVNSPSVQAFSPFVPAYITPTTYSNWFNGSSGYLSIADNAAFTLGTNNFTIEAWVYPVSAFANYTTIIAQSNNGAAASQAFDILVTSTGAILVEVYIGSTAYTITSSTTLSLNAWAHVALVRSGSTFTLYINGISVGTLTNAGSINDSAVALTIGAETTPLRYWNGCISNVRIVNGTALYTAAFTPPTAPLTNITNTSLLTCQSSTFIDNSTNAFTITATGNVQPVTSPTPFPAKVDTTTLNSAYSTSLIGGSGYFDGTGDYLTAPNNAAFNLGSNDFTIECWVYQTVSTSSGSFISQWQSANDANSSWQLMQADGTTLTPSFGFNITTPVTIVSNTATKLNTWYHIAAVRSGSTVTLYLNGVSVGSSAISGSIKSVTNPVGIGTRGGSANNLNFGGGYIACARVVNGTARYTSNFAPPVAPLTNVTNTSLLLNYTNGAIFDNTAKNVLETVGNAQISTTQSKWGGSSMYFNGSTSYLTRPYSPLFALGSGNFTVEAWINTTQNGSSDYPSVVGRWAGGNSWDLRHSAGDNAGKPTFAYNNGSTNANLASTGSTIYDGLWHHLCVVRNGNTLTMYVDGVSVATASFSGTIAAATSTPLTVGNTSGTAYYTGYIDDLRITLAARYLANFTPPTSQLQDQ